MLAQFWNLISSILFERELTMNAPLDVFRLHSNDVGVWILSVDSLVEALNVMCKKGCGQYGQYIVYSQKTGRRRFYNVNWDRKIVSWEYEELAIPRT